MATVVGESSKLWAIAEAAQSGFEFAEGPVGLSAEVSSICGSVAGAFESTCYTVASVAAYLIGAIISIAVDVTVCLGVISLAFYCLLRRGDDEFPPQQGIVQESNWEWFQGMCQLASEWFESFFAYFNDGAGGLVNATTVVVS